jgi:methionyl-tRNA formyltransferase
MKIVFFGTPQFAVVSLRRILETGRHPVAGVVTQPDRPAGRGRKPAPTPVSKCAREFGLPVLKPAQLGDSGFLAEIKKWGADCFVVVAYRILPEAVFTMPVRGTINLHASLLPSYRGAAPIRRVLFDGRSETGLTTFLIQKKVDTGDILLTRKIPIGPEENHGELEHRMAEAGADLLVETLDAWERKEVKPRKQDPTLASNAPKITAEDRQIDWTQSSQKISDRVRGLAPDPGATSHFRGQQVKILQCQTAAAQGTPRAGETVTAHPKEGITVATGDGALRLTKIQPAGKRPISGVEFVRGYRIEPGELWS